MPGQVRCWRALDFPSRSCARSSFWFATGNPERFAPERFPIFIAESELGSIYGFPLGDEPGVKVANHSGGEPADVETVDRTVRPGEEADVADLGRAVPVRRVSGGR